MCQLLTCVQTFRLRHGAYHTRFVRTSKYAALRMEAAPTS